MRTAHFRFSGEYLLDLFITPSSQEMEPPTNPGRFNAWISLAAAQGAEKAKNTKVRLTGEMTRAEIAEAQKLSRKYWDAFGPNRNSQ